MDGISVLLWCYLDTAFRMVQTQNANVLVSSHELCASYPHLTGEPWLMHYPERTGLWACTRESSWLRIVGSTMVRQMFLGYIGNLAKKEQVSKPERLPASSISLHGLFCGSMPWVSAMISLSDGLWHRCVRQINEFLHYFPLVRIFCHSIRKVNKNNAQAVTSTSATMIQI